ncbi:MAG: hypothetical protein ACYCQK_08235 [Acidiferrobacteraceae bacterium]
MRQQINLYHPIFRRQQKRFSALAMAQAAGVVLLAAALLYSYTAWQVHSLSEALAAARSQRLAAAKDLSDATARFGGRGFARRVRLLRKQIRARERVRRLLASGRFGNTTGYSAYLVALARGDIPGLWITSFRATGNGASIALKGAAVAPDLVPRYVANLGARAPFAGINFGHFVITRAASPARYVRFVIARDAGPAQGGP